MHYLLHVAISLGTQRRRIQTELVARFIRSARIGWRIQSIWGVASAPMPTVVQLRCGVGIRLFWLEWRTIFEWPDPALKTIRLPFLCASQRHRFLSLLLKILYLQESLQTPLLLSLARKLALKFLLSH